MVPFSLPSNVLLPPKRDTFPIGIFGPYFISSLFWWSIMFIRCFCQPCLSDLFSAAYLRSLNAVLDWNFAGLFIFQSTEFNSVRGVSRVEFLLPT